MNIWYIIKVWLSVIIVTPVFIILLLMDGIGFNLEVYFYGIVLALVYSLPFLIILLLFSLIIDKYIKNPVTLKFCYIVASLIGMCITIYIIVGGKSSHSDEGFGSILMWYGITIFLFGMIYKVKTVPDVSKEDETA
jgi:hypothetical protein